MRTLIDRLFAPVDVASLVVFRVLFGTILVWEVWRYFDADWIRSYYIDPDLHFTFYGCGWVTPWGGNGMYYHFLLLGAAAAGVTLGIFYRLSAAVVFLAFTYVFLLEQARYLNHFYLVCLISFLLIFLPTHRAGSLDARLFPSRRSDFVPAWSLWLMRTQIGLVYFFAAVAKMNGDWLQGEPMRMWLAKRDDYTLLGPLIPIGKLFDLELVVYMFAYGGLCLDLFVFPLLVWKRTRPYAFAFACTFHLTNNYLFDIGIFPWFMLAATTLFFDPSWPRRFLNFPRRGDAPETCGVAGLTARRVVTVALGAWVAFQVLVPLRHFLYPGTVHWTEEGHRFSWHMKLRNKTSRVVLRVRDKATRRVTTVRLTEHLTARQIRKMGGRPDMLLQFVHHLRDEYARNGQDVEIYSRTVCALNGRDPQLIIDPDVDLTTIERTLGHADWILPLTTPLKRQPTEDEPEDMDRVDDD